METKIKDENSEFDLKRIPKSISQWGFLIMVLTSFCAIFYTRLIKIPIKYECSCESGILTTVNLKKNHPFENNAILKIEDQLNNLEKHDIAKVSNLVVLDNKIQFDLIDFEGNKKKCEDIVVTFTDYTFFDLVVSQF